MTTSWQAAEVTLWATGRGTDLALAERFGIRIASAETPDRWQLVPSANRIELRAPQQLGGSSLRLDPQSGQLGQRLRTSRPNDPLPRACGLHRRTSPTSLLDATAGLGRDAMVLADLGVHVVATERIPALAFLLADTAQHVRWRGSLTVVAGSAESWLGTCDPTARPHVVYLDPMFSDPGKAQVKKEMQICRLLAGPPEDPKPLFELARAVARERVVVKRHHGEEPIAEGRSFQVDGERIRFDVYLTASTG